MVAGLDSHTPTGGAAACAGPTTSTWRQGVAATLALVLARAVTGFELRTAERLGRTPRPERA